jgi:hypothetical protein
MIDFWFRASVKCASYAVGQPRYGQAVNVFVFSWFKPRPRRGRLY